MSNIEYQTKSNIQIECRISNIEPIFDCCDFVVVDFLFIVTPIVVVCNFSMFCCTLLYVHSSIAIILMGKRELVALLNLFSWCLMMVEWLFLAVPWGCLRFVIVVFPDHIQLLFLLCIFCSCFYQVGYLCWRYQQSAYGAPDFLANVQVGWYKFENVINKKTKLKVFCFPKSIIKVTVEFLVTLSILAK